MGEKPHARSEAARARLYELEGKLTQLNSAVRDPGVSARSFMVMIEEYARLAVAIKVYLYGRPAQEEPGPRAAASHASS